MSTTPAEDPGIIVEALCRRPAGVNVVYMPDMTPYDFRDNGTGRQVAVVKNPEHAATLLAIPEGYRYAGTPQPAPVAASLPKGTGVLPAATGASPATGQTETPLGLDDLVAAGDLGAVRRIFETEIGSKASPKQGIEVLADRIRAQRAAAQA